MIENYDEFQLREYYRHLLGDEFTIREEIIGHNLINNKQVRIDFMLKASEQLVNLGFVEGWIGLEIKSIASYRMSRQFSQLAWQAITYSQSMFDGVRPEFVLMAYNQGRNNPKSRFANKRISDHIQSICALCRYANVGLLSPLKSGFDIRFGGVHYFSTNYGDYSPVKSDIGLNRYTGNCITPR